MSRRERRPRIVWDMTFASKSRTGTRVYARNLFAALRQRRAWEFVETSAAEQMRAEGTGNALTGARNVWWLRAQLPQLLAKQNADLVHAAAYLGATRAPCPMVVNVLDTTYLARPNEFDWKWRLYARTLIPPTVRRAAAVLTLSEHARGEIVRAYGLPRDKVQVVYPGTGAEFVRGCEAERLAQVRAAYQLDAPYLLFVGAQEPRKNIPAYLGALGLVRREFPNMLLALVGPRGRGSAELGRVIDAQGLSHAVRELGFVPSADLPALYAGAAAMLYASRLEGFGMPPVEALACGAPVVAAPNPPLPEVLGDAALWAEDDSPAALAQGVLHVLREPALVERLRATGLARAREFTWERAAELTCQVYERVLEERPTV